MTPFKLSPGPPAPLEQSWSPAQLWWCPCSAMDCGGLDPSLQTWLPILALFCHVTTSLCGTGRPACGLLSQLGLRPALSTLTCKMVGTLSWPYLPLGLPCLPHPGTVGLGYSWWGSFFPGSVTRLARRLLRWGSSQTLLLTDELNWTKQVADAGLLPLSILCRIRLCLLGEHNAVGV